MIQALFQIGIKALNSYKLIWLQKYKMEVDNNQKQLNERQFQALIENNFEIISLTDESLKVLYRSPSSTRCTGWTDEDMENINGTTQIHTEDTKKIKSIIQSAIRNPGKLYPFLMRYLHKEGYYIWLEGTVIKLPYESIVKGLVFNCHDVSERIKLEQLVLKTTTLARMGSWEVDFIKGTVYWSDIIREIHEIEDSFVPDLEKGINFYKEGYSRDLITQKVKEIMESGASWDLELEIVTAKNNERWIRIIGEAEFVNGKCVRIYGSLQDINERKKAEEQILKANRLYAFISAINQSIIHIKDRQELADTVCNIAVSIGKFKMAWIGFLDENKRLNIVSMRGDENSTDDLRKYSGMDYTSALLRSTSTGKALSTGEYAASNDVQNDPAMLPWKEEHVQHGIKSNISLPIKKFDKVIGIFGFNSTTKDYFDSNEIALLKEAASDISFALEVMKKDKLRAQTEELLLQNESRLKKAQAIAHIGHWELDLATGVAAWSEEACKIYGLDPLEIKQSFETWLSFLHPDDVSHVMRILKDQRENLSDASFDHRIIRKDGITRHIHAESKFEFDVSDKSIGLYGIVQDITEKKEAESALESSAIRFREFFESAPAGLVVLDINTLTFVEFNQNALKLLKYSFSEILNKGPIDISPQFQPDGRSSVERAQELILNTVNGEMPVSEWMIVDGEGTEIMCELRLALLSDKYGSQILASFVDIRERKKAEHAILELNETLESKVKDRTTQLQEINNDLESFNASVSHDLRSPLQVISGYSSILSMKYGDVLGGRGQNLLKGINDYIKQMSLTMESLLDLSHLGTASMIRVPVKMIEVVKAVVAELKFVNNPAVVEIIIEDLPDSPCDAGLIKQVWLNLISNAIKYSKHKNKPLVIIGSNETDEGTVYFVKDNGEGFDMKHYDKLFKAFQRLHTSSEFEGVGIGLTIVHRIITKHGGRIWAEGKAGEGAAFYFTLPLVN
ncbi:MAG TPA: PAS domain S-box protein [Saprospiraceae bacterium]|nr:PAS domain S-box protein [Saprospiraceae bacterium]